MGILSKLYPYPLSERIDIYRDKLYTLWMRPFLGHLGKDAIIGRSSRLWGGGGKQISIGDNAIIAANAVVTEDVPANTLVAGVPASVRRRL